MTDLEKYPHLFPDRGAVPFDLNASLVLGASSGLTLLDSIPIPAIGYEGILRYVELGSSDFGTTASPHSFFQFQVGQKPVQWYSEITQPMLANSPVLIYLLPNLQFQIFANNLTASGVSMRYRLTGWYYRIPGSK